VKQYLVALPDVEISDFINALNDTDAIIELKRSYGPPAILYSIEKEDSNVPSTKLAGQSPYSIKEVFYYEMSKVS
jgi:hypothetical protein